MSASRGISERNGGDVGVGRVGPEKGFAIVGARRHAAAGEETSLEPGALADVAPAPDGGANDGGAPPDPRVADDGGGVLGVGREVGGVEDAAHPVERAGARRERSAARERFERSAEEIARAAEVGEAARVKDPSDLLGCLPRRRPLIEERLPEVGDERGLPGRDSREEARREDADPRVEEGRWSADAEGRDAVPFGLKRRVALRLPVFDDEERGGATGGAVRGEQSGVVGGECCIGIDHQEVVRREKLRRIAKSARGPEDLRLAEKRELWQARSRLAQIALDLIGEVMKINRYLAESGVVKPAQVRHRERHVEKGKERLGDALGDGPEPQAAPGTEKDGPHARET